jgi:hypothetical protein
MVNIDRRLRVIPPRERQIEFSPALQSRVSSIRTFIASRERRLKDSHVARATYCIGNEFPRR